MSDSLNELENKSIFILREAHKKFSNSSLLWSAGKDSTVLLWLCKKAFFGKIPFKVIHIDTGYKFKEIYEFRDKYSKSLGINMIIAKKNTSAIPEISKFDCCMQRKTEALKELVKKNKIDALIVGIRRDEHGIRNKERFFSPRDKESKWNTIKIEKNGNKEIITPLQDAEFDSWGIYATDFGEDTDHVRIHPLLNWNEKEIWEYIKQEKIPIIDLYLSKNGKRYRSIGCECCCKPIISDANTIDKIVQELKSIKTNERDGRIQDKEDDNTMQKLRSLGYM